MTSTDARPSVDPIELLWRPRPSAWSAAASASMRAPSRADDATRALFREEMGLPATGPLALSGHQPGLWHAGIAAKRFATTAFADHMGWAAGWIVVDHDADDAGVVRVPIDAGSALDVEAARFATEMPTRPLGLRGPVTNTDALERAAERAPDVIAPRLSGAVEALSAHRSASSLASQLACAAEALLAPVDPSPIALTGSLRISGTRLFADVADRVRAAPERCRVSYNRAVERAGTGAGVRALLPGELPFWVVRDGRRSPWREDRLDAPAVELAPRGLLMTGLLRYAGCELFVHGFGGGGRGSQPGYDRVTEAWLADWLGWTALAPAAVASATVLLDLPGDAPPTAGAVAAARWRAHHARHDPAILNDPGTLARKRELVAAARDGDTRETRARAFAELHELLGEMRTTHAATIGRLAAAADTLDTQRAAAGLRADRTWSIALHGASRLAQLRASIRGAFEG